jgi:hypothetical protein
VDCRGSLCDGRGPGCVLVPGGHFDAAAERHWFSRFDANSRNSAFARSTVIEEVALRAFLFEATLGHPAAGRADSDRAAAGGDADSAGDADCVDEELVHLGCEFQADGVPGGNVHSFLPTGNCIAERVCRSGTKQQLSQNGVRAAPGGRLGSRPQGESAARRCCLSRNHHALLFGLRFLAFAQRAFAALRARGRCGARAFAFALWPSRVCCRLRRLYSEVAAVEGSCATATGRDEGRTMAARR